MSIDKTKIVDLNIKKEERILEFRDFQKQNIKFDMDKLKEAYNQIVNIKKFDDGGGVTHFGAISLTQIPGTTWDNIDGSFYNMVATKTDGTLWAWGYGGRVALDNNNIIDRSSPTQIPGQWEKTVDGGGYITTALKN